MELDWDLIRKRIAEQLELVGMSERAASIEATGSPDTIRYMRTRKVMPAGDRLSRLGLVLRATPGYLLGLGENNGYDEIMASREADLKPPAMPAPEKIGKVFPVFATWPFVIEEQGEVFGVEEAEVGVIDLNVPFRQLRFPLGAEDGADLYGFYIPGDSLSPAYESGELVIADRTRRPALRDFVVVLFGNGISSNGDHVIAVGRLKRHTDKSLEIEQFSRSGKVMTIPTNYVGSIHRILRSADLVGDTR